MLEAEDIVNNFINNFIEEWDGRSNKFYNKVKSNKSYYVNLVNIYNQTKSANKVSEQIGIDSKYITTILKKFGVPTFRRKMDEETLSLIIEDKLNGMSLGQLKIKYNFSLETLKRNLNKRGINTSIENPFDKLNEDIIEEYKTKQLKEIAKDYGVGVKTVKSYLVSKGIKLRTLSQSVSLNIKNKGVNFKGENIQYYSIKNDKSILANSSYELARFIELETDSSVLLYTKDVETICYNNCNNSYTADIYIEYIGGKKVVEEVKPNWYLKYMNKTLELINCKTKEEVAAEMNISVKSVNKFILSDLKFKEAKKYFPQKGIEYKIITEDDININLAKCYLK
jgi:DNA-binding CsgD family transcriptional regulator